MDADKILRSYLGLRYNLVGVRILKRGDNVLKQLKPAKSMRFCELVKAAASGKEFIAEIDDVACPSAEICLGFREPEYIDIEPRIKPAETQAVYVNEVENADVILMILTPEQVMHISILLRGIKSSFRGELGVCGEATARVYEDKKPHLSFLCNGARIFADFKEREFILGMPYDLMIDLAKRIERLERTGGALCGCQISDIPDEIVENLRDIGLEKGTDYFFGKIKGKNIRIYLNKDEYGMPKYITFHFPIKDKKVILKKPFKVKTMENWRHIYATFAPEEIGIDLYTKENLIETINDIVTKVSGMIK